MEATTTSNIRQFNSRYNRIYSHAGIIFRAAHLSVVRRLAVNRARLPYERTVLPTRANWTHVAASDYHSLGVYTRGKGEGRGGACTHVTRSGTGRARRTSFVVQLGNESRPIGKANFFPFLPMIDACKSREKPWRGLSPLSFEYFMETRRWWIVPCGEEGLRNFVCWRIDGWIVVPEFFLFFFESKGWTSLEN